MASSIDPRILARLRKVPAGVAPDMMPLSGDPTVDESFDKPQPVENFSSPSQEQVQQFQKDADVQAVAENTPDASDLQLMQSRNGDTISGPSVAEIAQFQKDADAQAVEENRQPKRSVASEIVPQPQPNGDYSVPGYDDSDEDLRAAQEAASNNRTINALGKSGDMLVSALTGTKRQGQFYDQLDKNSLQNVQDLQDRRKAQDQSLEFQTKVATRDPNSPDNQAFRSFLKQQPEFSFLTKSPNFDKLTLANPALTKIVEMYQKSQDRKAAVEVARQNAIAKRELDADKLGIAKDRLQVSKDRFADKLKQQDELTPKQLEEVKNFNTTLDRIEQLSNLKRNFNTGPLDSRVASFRKALGVDDAKRSAFKAKTGRLLSDYMKGISGTAISEPEARRLQSNFLSDNLSDETFLQTLEDLYKEIDRNKQIALNTYSQGGRNVEALRGNPMQQQQPKAKSKPGPGSIVVVKGVKYKVGQDGDSLEQIQ